MGEHIEREALLNKMYMQGYATSTTLRIRDLIWEQPAADVAPVRRWISVEDRLPEPEQEVLLIVHGWSDTVFYIGKYHHLKAEKSWMTGIESKESDWLIHGWSYLREPCVTHWMPLPEPPEGGHDYG